MITTKEVNVILDKGPTKLERTTTKGIDASVKVEHPKKRVKATSITTTSMADVADMAEKRRRDAIMAERKTYKEIQHGGEKGLKKLAMQFVFVDFDGLIQAVSRRELK